VREDKNTAVNGMLYDFDLPEHYMLLVEWTNLTFQNFYGNYIFAGGYQYTHAILINGKGDWPEASPNLNIPLQTYTVKKGFRYRFRLINSGVDWCLMTLSVEGHTLTVIASDGSPIEPVEVTSIVSLSGERYDFVVNANASVEKDYWIKIRGEGGCLWSKSSQRAILRYERDNLQQDEYTSTIPFSYGDSASVGLVFF
jgi:L-ascorbate oxidase